MVTRIFFVGREEPLTVPGDVETIQGVLNSAGGGRARLEDHRGGYVYVNAAQILYLENQPVPGEEGFE